MKTLAFGTAHSKTHQMRQNAKRVPWAFVSQRGPTRMLPWGGLQSLSHTPRAFSVGRPFTKPMHMEPKRIFHQECNFGPLHWDAQPAGRSFPAMLVCHTPSIRPGDPHPRATGLPCLWPSLDSVSCPSCFQLTPFRTAEVRTHQRRADSRALLGGPPAHEPACLRNANMGANNAFTRPASSDWVLFYFSPEHPDKTKAQGHNMEEGLSEA